MTLIGTPISHKRRSRTMGALHLVERERNAERAPLVPCWPL